MEDGDRRDLPSSIRHLPSSFSGATVPDERRHRGAHPEDPDLFGPAWHGPLRDAVADFSWLLSKDYASPSALKVVGDRYNLSARQRTAVMRSACSDAQLAARRSRQLGPAAV